MTNKTIDSVRLDIQYTFKIYLYILIDSFANIAKTN